jgi:hypothetical protein
MPDIITAKCFGCGHVIRVPVALGGKKAKCPQCAGVIVIPEPSRQAGDFVSDEQLPEVARDGDPITDDDPVPEGIPVEEPGEEPARGRTPAPQRAVATGTPRGGTRASGGRDRGGRGGRPTSRTRSSSTGLVVGIGIAAVVLVVVLGVALSRGGGGAASGGKAKQGSKAPPVEQVTDADLALQRRCEEYFQSVKQANVARISEFYASDEAEMRRVRPGIAAMLERGVNYQGATIKSAKAETGVVVIMDGAGAEKTINWNKGADGTWFIADKP